MTYYHGGVPGLNVGALILPPSVTGQRNTILRTARKLAPEGPQREDRVYITTDRAAAFLFAALWPRGTIYAVEPRGPVEHDPDELTPLPAMWCSFQTTSARVTFIVEKRCMLTPDEIRMLIGARIAFGLPVEGAP